MNKAECISFDLKTQVQPYWYQWTANQRDPKQITRKCSYAAISPMQMKYDLTKKAEINRKLVHTAGRQF